MLEKTELRIGNFVKYHDDDTLFEVTKIDELGIGVKNEEQETWIEYDCFSGAPITENWLVNLGFESNGDEHEEQWFHKDEELFGVHENTLATIPSQGWSHIWDGAYTNAPCQFVHQLKNLFFALTGKELVSSNQYPV